MPNIEPHFNSMAELKRKYMEATDREARYRLALRQIEDGHFECDGGEACKAHNIAKTALNEGKG